MIIAVRSPWWHVVGSMAGWCVTITSGIVVALSILGR